MLSKMIVGKYQDDLEDLHARIKSDGTVCSRFSIQPHVRLKAREIAAKRVLIMFSGGVDSTNMLLREMEAGMVIDLVYVTGVADPIKHEAELHRRAMIIDVMRNDPELKGHIHSDTIVDMSGYRTNESMKFQQLLPWFSALMMVTDPAVHTHAAMGYISGDSICYNLPSVGYAWEQLLSAVYGNDAKVVLSYPLIYRTKPALLRELPKAYRELVWVCESPEGHDISIPNHKQFCWTCAACKTLKGALIWNEYQDTTDYFEPSKTTLDLNKDPVIEKPIEITKEVSLMSNAEMEVIEERQYSFYLAGPEVFYPKAEEHGKHLVSIVEGYGFKGVFPLDAEVNLSADMTGKEKAVAIYLGNIKLIEQCDAVIANVNNFRGQEPDSGTAFEIGYAAALGKPIFLYLSDGRPLTEKTMANPNGLCQFGYKVEDFDLPVNLMLACAADEIYHGSLHAAMSRIAEQLKEGLHSL